MFATAVFRLTFWYLVLIMAVSATFSILLYNGSTQELHRLERHQLVQPEGLSFMRPEITLLNKIHVAQIEASLERIRLGIIYFNLAIFVTGGLASYLLALRTLRPIEEALEAQSRFTADASHELRTPMTVIRSELEVALRDRTLTIKDSRALHVSTLEEIAKLEQLTNNLLTLARQDALPLLDTQKYQLDEILSEAVAQIRPKAVKKRVGLSQDDCGLSVMTERSSLLELLVILLDNAVK